MSEQLLHDREREREKDLYHPGDTPDADLIFDATQKRERARQKRGLKRKPERLKKERNGTHQELEQVIAVFLRRE